VSQEQARAALREVLNHLVDHGAIELGTAQSKKLIEAATALGAFKP
jgi:hypothetical protein